MGPTEIIQEINAYSQDEAIDIIRKEYPSDLGWFYILM